MKQLLPRWLTKPDAPEADLQAQLAAARAAQTAAFARVDAARRVFDELGNDAAQRDLAEARKAAELATEHVDRATRLLQANQQAHAAQDRAELERRRDELRTQLMPAAIAERSWPLEEEEAELLIELANLRARRWHGEMENCQRKAELLRVRETLGEQIGFVHSGIDQVTLRTDRILERLDREAAVLPQTDARWRFLQSIASALSPPSRELRYRSPEASEVRS